MTETGLKRYYTGECARLIANMVGGRAPGLDAEEFAQAVDAQITGLELKGRTLVIARELRKRLPSDYVTALAILVDSLGPELTEDQGMFNESWFLTPVGRFIEEFGLDHPEESLVAIEELTRRHTGEFAIRPYLRDHYDLTMATATRWASSPSHNVRRLASEGIRPRLPWAPMHRPFIEDPRPILTIINQLINDPSRYVRTSVANNLNDISKTHPELAVSTARRWLTESDTEETRWIVNKGLRTLIKRGDFAALELLGAQSDPGIYIRDVAIEPRTVVIGQPAQITAVVQNDSEQQHQIIVDYHIHYLKSDGQLRPNTFKLGRITLGPGETGRITKRRTFAHTTTRRLIPGQQQLSAQANGNRSATVSFTLIERSDL